MSASFAHLGLALLALALGACRNRSDFAPLPDLPAGFPYAYAVADCAPWDGPAVTLYLTPIPADSTDFPWPQLRISVWRSADTLPGRTFAWPSDQQVGAATRCEGPAACKSADSAQITFKPAAGDSTLRGSTRLVFPSAEALSGGFQAVWRESHAACG